MSEKLIPTIGRMVYYKTARDLINGGESTTMPAIITDVINDNVVSLAIFSNNGTFFRRDIDNGQLECQWDWMPYTKEKAKS